MAITSAAEILAIHDRIPRKLHVEEWGCEVYVQALSAEDYARQEQMTATELACAGLCDAGGVQLGFTPQQIVDMARTKHAAAIDRVALEVLRLTKAVEDPSPAPAAVRSFSDKEWRQVESQFKALANDTNRGTSDPNNSVHGTVREGDQTSRPENAPVCA